MGSTVLLLLYLLKQHDWQRQRRQGPGQRWSQEASQGVEGQHSGHHQACNPTLQGEVVSRGSVVSSMRRPGVSSRFSWRMSSVMLSPTLSMPRGYRNCHGI